MEDKFNVIDDQEAVISFSANSVTLKLKEFMRFANDFLENNGIKGIHNNLLNSGRGQIPLQADNWVSHGIDSEILSPSLSTWKKGKVRMKVVLEFCPDEPENEVAENSDPDSLDDIRKTL